MVRARIAGVWTQRIAIGLLVAGVVAFALRVGSSSSQAIDFRDPTVWLPAPTGELVQANSATLEISARVSIGAAGDAFTVLQEGAGALALNRTKGELVKVDGVTQKATQRTAVAGAAAESRLLGQPGVARVVTRENVIDVDPETGMAGSAVRVSPFNAVAMDRAGVVWGLATGGKLLAVDSTASEVTAAELKDIRPLTVVSTGGEAFVLDGGPPSALRALQGTGQVRGSHCVEAAVGASAVAGGAISGDRPSVVIADPATGAIRVSNTAENTCPGTVVRELAGARFGAPVVSGELGYIPVLSTGEIYVVKLADGSITGHYGVVLPGHPIDLVVKDGTVWFNDPTGSAAGVLGKDGFRRVDKVETVGSANAASGGQAGQQGNSAGSATGGSGSGNAGSNSPSGTGDGRSSGGAENPNAGSTSNQPGDSATTRTAGRLGGESNPSEEPDPSGLLADFTFTSRIVEVGETVSFTDTSTGGPTAWTWEFGDGVFASGPKTSHAWSSAGTFTVTLRVENATASSSASATIQVLGPEDKVKPKADFRFSASRVEVGQTVTFTDRSSGHPSKLEWSFGDGATAVGSTVTHAWNQPGTFNVTLTATNLQGSDTTAPTAITVFSAVQPPLAAIGGGAPSASIGQTVNYFSRSTGNPTDLKWNFGDGTTAVGQVVSHAWSRTGTFTVTLDVANSAGSNSAATTITVSELTLAPVARFTQSLDVAEENQTIRFTSISINNPTQLSWDFGDGASASGTQVTHSYRQARAYTVTLRASSPAGQSTAQQQVTVVAQLPAPVAAFGMTPDGSTQITTLTAVQFVNMSTGGEPTSWLWDFGDGSTSSQKSPTHQFETQGTYTVKLTVSNARGSSSTTRSLKVLPAPPRAEFTWQPAAPSAGVPVLFTDRSEGAVSWSWDFGDGTTSTERSPSHPFAASGSYPVKLTVTNEFGPSLVVHTVKVNPPAPVAAFTYAPTANITTGTTITFTSTSTGGPVETFDWDFGDGTPHAATASPTHRFTTAGNYDVTLRVSNVTNAGAPSTARQSIVVTVPKAAASFTVAATPRAAGYPIQFTSHSTGSGITSYAWNWGDGTPPLVTNDATPTHIYAATGTFHPSLVVTNPAGASDPWVGPDIIIVPAPVATFTAPATGVVGQPIAFNSAGSEGTLTWNFGDGSADTTAPHTFTTSGTHTVSLVATSGGVSTAPFSRPITISPDAAFTYAAGKDPREVKFTNQSVGATSYSWNFGDGTAPVTQASPTHVFAGTETTFDVILTANGNNGTTSTSRVRVSIATPTASFTYSPLLLITTATTVTFDATSSVGEPFISYTWQWDDGTADTVTTSATTTHRFATPGTRHVRLIVTNGAGSDDVIIDVGVLP